MGEVFRNPDLAKAFRLLAAGGPRAFYSGEISKAILATSRQLGGTMTADDLQDFSAEWVEPHLNYLQRLESLRIAAQRAGHGGT